MTEPLGLPDLDKIIHESERTAKRLAEITHEIEEVEGRGLSHDGCVSAYVDHSGGLLDTELTPSAMRLESGELAQRITEAVRAAQGDAQQQVNEMMSGVLGDEAPGLPMAADELREHLQGMEESFARSMEESLLAIDEIAKEP